MPPIGREEARRALAQRPETESDVLIELAGDCDSEVRRLVAAHPGVSVSCLRLLADALYDARGKKEFAR